MKIAKGKTKAIAIAIFLMLSIGASMVLVPTANAHTQSIFPLLFFGVTDSLAIGR